MHEKIAVVIPSHNYARFLDEAVRSVLAQTRRADEIVIVDDGSTDHTPLIVDKLKEIRPIIAIRHGHAMGPNVSRNVGVRACTADLVVLLDADDMLSTTYLEDAARVVTETPADFAYTATQCFGTIRRVVPARSFEPTRLRRNNQFNNSAMFRVSLFERLGGFREELDIGGLEDWDFWLRAVEDGAVGAPVPGCWLDYRRHPNSRNSLSALRLVRAHLRIWRLHRPTMGVVDFCFGLAAALLSSSRARSQARMRRISEVIGPRR